MNRALTIGLIGGMAMFIANMGMGLSPWGILCGYLIGAAQIVAFAVSTGWDGGRNGR